MAYAIVHFLAGASILLVLAAPIAYRIDLGGQWPLWFVAFGGIWGLVPDIHHISPVAEAGLYALHESPWADLFAFHYSLDRPAVRGRYVESVFASLLGFLGVVSLYALAETAGVRSRRSEPDAVAFAAPTIASVLVLIVVAVLGGLLYAAIW